MDSGVFAAPDRLLEPEEIAAYRRDGFVAVRRIIGPKLVKACVDDLIGLATGRLQRTSTIVMFEPGYDADAQDAAPEQREDYIRKFAYYVEDSRALRAAAMNERLHRILDQLVGTGRVMFQDMALIKPPLRGSKKDWHQDAAYFRVSDPRLIVGVWIALDPSRRENGCMEFIPGSHLKGPAIHVQQLDINACHIRRDQIDLARRVAIELDPGDALIFHPLVHHYTEPNRSALRRRAVQFHYHQLGMDWGTLEDHRRDFHDESGAYCGCTVQPPPVPPELRYEPKHDRAIPVVPEADWN
jgi:phytanoyl-CoA hydroxylase